MLHSMSINSDHCALDFQDSNDKPKSNDPSVFVKNKDDGDEFELSDTISIADLKKLKP